ncbi:MAG TPA: amidohydrolase [Steroidobacteraceae bacterium]|nr:amidohydrolase [Steroidobacteraceae bacterium]
MKKPALALLIGAVLCACDSKPPHPNADVVILHGDVRTMDSTRPNATALAIAGERIAFVGDDAGARKWIGGNTQVVDTAGATVLPGLIDSHIHVAEGALARGGCSLEDDQLTIEQAADKIKACFANDKDSKWLIVTDVNAAGFKANRRELDAIVRDRPLFLWSSDGHSGWVNSRALELAKITRKTPNPDDGRIERDARGEATGFLVDGAVGLISSAMDQPTPAKRLEKLRWILPQLHAAGITSYLEANTDAETVAAYAELARLKQLTARVTIALESGGANTPAEFARLKGLRTQVGNDPLLRADFIKLFADGAMEFPTQTAALLEPYNNADGRPGTSKGKLYLASDAMAAFIKQADADGFNVHIHAIGDSAVREALDALGVARAAGSKRLYSIAHLQLIDAADLPRFAALDVPVSLQLLWAQPDNYSIEALTPWLGPERMARQYPARSLADHHTVIAGGSDWDVSSFNPFAAIATAMSRTNPEKPERGPLNVKEALTLDEMLTAYTINAARLIGRDAEIGSLVVGKAADVIVLDGTLTKETAADTARKTRVAHTFFAGREMSRADAAH